MKHSATGFGKRSWNPKNFSPKIFLNANFNTFDK